MENHAEVYAAESLVDSAEYEAKAFSLDKSLPRKFYESRVRNLKRLQSQKSFICCVTHSGREFVFSRIHGSGEAPGGRSQRPGKSENVTGSLRLRRGTSEFEAVFPRLLPVKSTPAVKQERPSNSPGAARKSSYAQVAKCGVILPITKEDMTSLQKSLTRMKKNARKFAAKMGTSREGLGKISMAGTGFEVAKKEFDAGMDRYVQTLKQGSLQLRKQLGVFEILEALSNDHGQQTRARKAKTPEQVRKKRLGERQARRKKRALQEEESTQAPWLVGEDVES